MVTIRVAEERDIPDIQELMQSVPRFWRPEWRPDVLKLGIDSANGLAFVAETRGRIVGFVCAHDVGFRTYLSELIVSDSHRGKGIGKGLVKTVEKSAAERGCHVLVSDVWPDAEGFYRRLGWSAPDVVLLRKRVT